MTFLVERLMHLAGVETGLGPVEIRKRFAYGVIESSLFESAAQAGLSDKTIMNVAGIFAWDIDFILDILCLPNLVQPSAVNLAALSVDPALHTSHVDASDASHEGQRDQRPELQPSADHQPTPAGAPA